MLMISVDLQYNNTGRVLIILKTVTSQIRNNNDIAEDSRQRIGQAPHLRTKALEAVHTDRLRLGERMG